MYIKKNQPQWMSSTIFEYFILADSTSLFPWLRMRHSIIRTGKTMKIDSFDDGCCCCFFLSVENDMRWMNVCWKIISKITIASRWWKWRIQLKHSGHNWTRWNTLKIDRNFIQQTKFSIFSVSNLNLTDNDDIKWLISIYSFMNISKWISRRSNCFSSNLF